jgi:hypothetical protein
LKSVQVLSSHPPQNRNSNKIVALLKCNNSDEYLNKQLLSNNKLKKGKSQNQHSKRGPNDFLIQNDRQVISPSINGSKSNKINFHFLSRLKEKLKQDSDICRPMHCTNEKIFKHGLISKVMNCQSSGQTELNYNLFQGAFNTKNNVKGNLDGQFKSDSQLNSQQSNALRKCATDRLGILVIKQPIETLTDHTKANNNDVAKKSVDSRPSITLSNHVRSFLKKSQKNNEKELQRTILNTTKNEIVSKLQLCQKSSAVSRNSNFHLTSTMRDFRREDSNGHQIQANKGKAKEILKEQDSLYNTFSINRVVNPLFLPISNWKNMLKANNHPHQGIGFYLKAHSRKENRLDEYNFFQESPAQNLRVLVDFKRQPSLQKIARSVSSKNNGQKVECISKVKKTSNKNKNGPFELLRPANPSVRKGSIDGKNGVQIRETRNEVLISKLFKAA